MTEKKDFPQPGDEHRRREESELPVVFGGVPVRSNAAIRVIAGMVFVVALVVSMVGTAETAPPRPAPKESAVPAPQRPPGAMQPVGGVQSGEMPLPDLSLERIDYLPGEKKGTNSDGTSCYAFGLRAIFRNIGEAGTGPFRIVWERAKAEQGPFELACISCSMSIQDAPPGVSMMPERGTGNCQDYRWFRVRLDPDPDGRVIELREDNNTLVQFH